MGNLPKEQDAAVKQGEGKDSKAPVQKVPVPEPGPGQILVQSSIDINSYKTYQADVDVLMIGEN